MPMPVEQRIHDNGFMEAAADLSAKQYRVVKVTADYAVNVCTSAGEAGYGILQDKPESGEVANVRDLGISRAVVGTGGISAGALWQTDANGAIITAATADAAGGRVLMGASAGEIAVVTVGYGNWPVIA